MPERNQANLIAIVEKLWAWDIEVALAGMELPPMRNPEPEGTFCGHLSGGGRNLRPAL